MQARSRVALAAFGCGALLASGLTWLLLTERQHAFPPSQMDLSDAPYGDGGTSDFYRQNGMLPAKRGVMIRTEPLDPADLPSNAARGIRFLYSSTSGVGTPRPIAVSGQILFPIGQPPTGGWPIVAWEHGTTGIADVCAPSWRGYLTRDRTYVSHWLEGGFAVVATDYEGLGTPGPHPYILYRSEAHGALDAIQAALYSFPKDLANQVVLVGQSQGSGAALGSAWLAPQYASDLKILGVVATGLVVEFRPKAGTAHPQLPVNYEDPADMDAAYAMLTVEGTDQSLHPDLDSRSIVTPHGIWLSHIARSACLGDLFKAAKAQHLSATDLFTQDLKHFQEGADEASTIPNGHISFPVFAGTGLADYEASLPGQYNAVAAMCDAGTAVTWKTYPGLTHNGTVNSSIADSMPFVRALLSGKPINDTCNTISIPGPLQSPTPGIPFNN